MKHIQDNCIKIKQSIIWLFLNLVSIQIYFLIVHFILKTFINSNIHFPYLMLCNLLTIIYILLRWKNTSYEVIPEGIYTFEGVFFRKQTAFDIKAFREIIVKQNLIQKLFGYGTIILVNPLLSKNLKLQRIQKPSKYASIIEKYRIEEVSKTGSTDTFIPFT